MSKTGAGLRNHKWILCIVLHVLVLTLHISLLVVSATKAERHVIIPFGRLTEVSTGINAGLQVLVTLIIVAILALAQPLALRRQLSKQQTLTALADQSSAWAGLGSALGTLKRNITFPAATLSIFTISLYFACLTALHTTTPILFSVQITTQPVSQSATTTVGTPQLFFNASYQGFVPSQNQSSLSPANRLPDADTGLSVDWYASSVSVGLFAANFSIQHPGLYNNRIYDILDDVIPTTSSRASVNYTDFHVSCGAIPDASVGISQSQSTNETNWVFRISATSNGHSFNISDVNLIGINRAEDVWEPEGFFIRIPGSSTPSNGRNLILYSLYNANSNTSSPIVDSQGSSGSSFAVDLMNGESPFPLYVQVIGCSVRTSNGTTVVDGMTNALAPGSEPGDDAVNHAWGSWEAQDNSGVLLEDYWGTMFMPQSSISLWPAGGGTTSEWTCSPTITDNSCHIPNAIEKYLNNFVFGLPESNVTKTSLSYIDFNNSTLGNLEAALGRATAMTMWTAAQAATLWSSLVSASGSNSVTYQSSILKGSAVVTKDVQVGQLKLNNVPLITGTAASILLLGLGFALLRPPTITQDDEDVSVHNFGFLQVVQMTGSLHQRLAYVEGSDTVKLRRAAMFDVRLQNGRLVSVGDARRAEKMDGSLSTLEGEGEGLMRV